MQTEWDALMVETFNLKSALEETRRELSQALYQNDAAVRVIARLTMERDQARQMLAQGGGRGDEMEVDNSSAAASEGIPKADLDVMVAKWTELSKGRKGRALPEDQAGADDVKVRTPETVSRGGQGSRTRESPGLTHSPSPPRAPWLVPVL